MRQGASVSPDDHQALREWQDELMRRIMAAAHAARDRGCAAIIKRGDEWSTQARAYEREHAPKNKRKD